MSILLAGNNQKKIGELKAIAPDTKFQTLSEAGITEELIEDGLSFHENAYQKARTIFLKTRREVLSDDSGLCIRALNNAPGIFSARYAGNQRSDSDNIRKVLNELQDVSDRFAFFITVLCFIDRSGRVRFFEGRVEGTILTMPRGSNGFGYDPVFVPVGEKRSFAEMATHEKNANSHRALALASFAGFLSQREETNNPL